MIVRSGEPCKYDQSPYGTICKREKLMGEKIEIYVQISKNENFPKWELIGVFPKCSERATINELKKKLNIKKIYRTLSL